MIKGVDEFYCMFILWVEYCILFCMDDVDMWFIERVYKLGLVKEDCYVLLKSKREVVENIVNFICNYLIKVVLINDVFENLGMIFLC